MAPEKQLGNMQPSAPKVVVYCDESCHDLAPHHRFMAIGGLWVPGKDKHSISREFAVLKRTVGLRGEVKWRKVSTSKLGAYKTLVDFFFDKAVLSFRTIVVEQAKVDIAKFHGMDRELAFYKFYYEMLEKWLRPGNEYIILLDRKTNKGADRYVTLRKCLENRLRGKAWIRELTVINSFETPLSQLCDLLTGAVAAVHNQQPQGNAKAVLAEYIATSAGFPALSHFTKKHEAKFNIFRIHLGE